MFGLPKSLVYAAELVCVFMGAKQISMVQYDSPNELQWKFPLVHDIIKRLAIALQQRPQLDLHLSITKYRENRSLILSRRTNAQLVELLRPLGQAQALHIVPFPDEPNFDYKQQIFNSYWNGLILGYPVPFIQSYCLSLTNELSDDDIESEGNRAQQAATDYFRRIVEEGPSNSWPHPIGLAEANPDILEDYMEASNL